MICEVRKLESEIGVDVVSEEHFEVRQVSHSATGRSRTLRRINGFSLPFDFQNYRNIETVAAQMCPCFSN